MKDILHEEWKKRQNKSLLKSKLIKYSIIGTIVLFLLFGLYGVAYSQLWSKEAKAKQAILQEEEKIQNLKEEWHELEEARLSCETLAENNQRKKESLRMQADNARTVIKAHVKKYPEFKEILDEELKESLFRSEDAKTSEQNTNRFPGDGKTTCGKVTKKGWSEEASYWIQYAYELSGCDQEFVVMLNGENGMWSHNRRHNPANNTVGVDWGFCGTNDYYHPAIVSDPRFLTDQAWQLGECLRMFREGTTFYAYLNKDRRENSRSQLSFSE